MHPKMMELLKSKLKDGKKFDKESKEGKAKEEILDEIMKMMDEFSGKKLKKVTVASPTTEGLKEGLEKAEEILEKKEDEDYDTKADAKMLKEKLSKK